MWGCVRVGGHDAGCTAGVGRAACPPRGGDAGGSAGARVPALSGVVAVGSRVGQRVAW